MGPGGGGEWDEPVWQACGKTAGMQGSGGGSGDGGGMVVVVVVPLGTVVDVVGEGGGLWQ